MAQRLVHIVDEVPGLDDSDHASLTLVLVLDGFLDAGNAAARAARHLVDLSRRPGRGDVRRRRAPRLPRPPARHVVRARPLRVLRRPRLVVRLLHDTGGTPYLLLHGPEPDIRWEAFARRSARWSSGSASTGWSAWARCRWPCRTPARSRSPSTPTTSSCSRATAGGAASCASRRARRRCSRCGWGSGATTRSASSRTSRTTSPSSSTPAPPRAARARREGRPAHRRPLVPARGGRRAGGRDHPLPRRQRGGQRGRHRPRAAVRRVHPRRGERQQPAGGDQPCRRARRSAGSSSSSWPGSTGRTTRTTTEGDRRMPASADELVELLDIESLDVDLFRGRQPDTDRQRVFGGQVAAQALIAGIRTTADDRHVHSLHSYFLRPGDTAVPIIYDVERLRDGRSFATRRIVARQHGHPIYFMTANFQRHRGRLRAPGRDARGVRRRTPASTSPSSPRAAARRRPASPGSGPRWRSGTSATPTTT